MARFGLVGPSYTSQSVNADAQRCLNMYPEQLESPNSKSPYASYPAAGLSAPVWSLVGPSVRGMLHVTGRLFAVSGTKLYELFSNGTSNVLGSVANDNKPVSMAAADINPTSGTPQLAVISSGILYVVNLMTNVMTLPPGVVGTPFQIVYADGFFVILNTNGVFQFSNPLDATTWPGIQASSVSIYNDKTLAMNVVHREIFFMSFTHGAVYGDAGDTPVPYDVVTGGDFEQGTDAPFTMIPLDNTMFWWGNNRDGGRVAWRASGYTPQRVSNHAVEFAVQSYTKISDAVSYGYQDQGHTFYQTYFPSANNGLGATWVYDVATSLWHEKAFLNSNGTYSAHRSQCHAFAFNNHYVGDWATGNIYQQSITITQDFGNNRKFLRRAPHIAIENEWIFYDQLQIDVEVGLTPTQVLQGTQPPTSFYLQDSTGALWNMAVNDLGILQTFNFANVSPGTLFLNDSSNSTTWQIGVSPFGQITTTAAPFIPGGNTNLTMFSTTGKSQWSLQVTNVGVLQTYFTANVTRNPQLQIRMSKDGGHTWSNPRLMDCGAVGEFKKRAIIRRMGRARDMVFEVSTTDPVTWRFIDAYLKATPSYEPTERVSDRVRKMA